MAQFGLFWTAMGLIAVLALIIGARFLGWLKLWRARASARPATPPKAAAAVHPDDAAIAALVAEANSALAKAGSLNGRPAGSTLASMPLYLIVGPEGSGKTSTFLNSGLEPQLLAGQGTAPVASTKLANVWLAKNAMFVEIGGLVFGADIARWNRVLSGLRGPSAVSMWRRLWREPPARVDLRGVVAFFDSKELTGGSSDPQRLERFSRDWQERLRAVAEVFATEFPVYLVVTKCDQIPFFSDFFRRLHDSETTQVLGCTLPILDPGASRPGEVFVEAEAKRLTASFRPLYQALAKRRLTQLAHEPDYAQRLRIYEFPRELKRSRTPLVQFLTDVFRPNPLALGPLLRGYYLTGVRETAAPVHAGAGMMDTLIHAPMDTTKLL